MRRALVLVLLLLPALAVHATAAVVTVTVSDTTGFSPKERSAAPGDSVTWTNPAPNTRNHTATSVVVPPSFTTPLIAPGSSATIVFPTGGTYPYRCSEHPYFHGVVVVGANTRPDIATNLTASGTLSGIVSVNGTAFDAEGPNAWTRITIDNVLVTTQSYGLQTEDARGWGWEFTWDTRLWSNGVHSVRIWSTDGAATSLVVGLNVTVSNPTYKDVRIWGLSASVDVNKVTFTGFVTNDGNLATGPFVVRLSHRYYSTNVTVLSAGYNLARGSTVPFGATWDATGKLGTWTFDLTADATGMLAESDETDNRQTRDVQLLINGPPRDVRDPSHLT